MYLVKAIKDEDEALDILQEVFLSIWARRHRLPNMESISPYLYAAARFKGLAFTNRKVNRNKFFDSFISFVAKEDPSMEEKHFANELAFILNREIDKLPPRMREVFVLSRYQDLSYREISERLNISDKTVKKQINKALTQLRLKLPNEHLLISLFLFATLHM